MTRFFDSLVLLSIAALAAGCSNSLGDDQDASAKDTDVQVVEPPDIKPVGEQERTAIERLREHGAEIDLDDTGHARIVELNQAAATDEDLKLLSRFPCLESLEITGGKITEAGLTHLEELAGLQRLYLDDLPIRSDALKKLSKLTQLDVLSLRKTKVDDKGMVHLKKLRQLTVLNLSNTAITNNALKDIQGLKKMDTLVLADTAATGASFTYLRSLVNLRTLNVSRCKAIDGHLLKLSKMPEMRMLYVYGCTVSEDEVEELTDRNPRLAVFGD